MRLLKAPAEHEPAIPAWVDTVVVVAGTQGVGKPLSEEYVHRPERFSELGGIKIGDTITSQALVNVLLNPEGGLKGIPPSARRIVVLNAGEDASSAAVARKMKDSLLGDFHAVISASLPNVNLMAGSEDELILSNKRKAASVFAVFEPVSGIILAAGSSERFGAIYGGAKYGGVDAKQLLMWGGKPFVRHVSETALAAGLKPVVVVTGYGSEQVGAALEGLDVSVVENRGWSTGQSSSVAAGVNALPESSGAAVFLLADQPQVTSDVLRALDEEHTRSLAPIIAPQVGGMRANPVLFDADTFEELHGLEGDTGGRALFSRYTVTWLPWLDENLLFDVDTPADYQRLLRMGETSVAAVVLAAGKSQRMGTPKMLLPWTDTTVINHVVDTLTHAGCAEIIVVTGAVQKEVENALHLTTARTVHNPRFDEDEMLVSLQVGLATISADASAVLVVLGDQPQIEASVVRDILDAYSATWERLIVPSYKMRRGHPWLVARGFWDEIMALPARASMRQFLDVHDSDIHYLVVDAPSVLKDLDTPEDYAANTRRSIFHPAWNRRFFDRYPYIHRH